MNSLTDSHLSPNPAHCQIPAPLSTVWSQLFPPQWGQPGDWLNWKKTKHSPLFQLIINPSNCNPSPIFSRGKNCADRKIRQRIWGGVFTPNKAIKVWTQWAWKALWCWNKIVQWFSTGKCIYHVVLANKNRIDQIWFMIKMNFIFKAIHDKYSPNASLVSFAQPAVGHTCGSEQSLCCKTGLRLKALPEPDIKGHLKFRTLSDLPQWWMPNLGQAFCETLNSHEQQMSSDCFFLFDRLRPWLSVQSNYVAVKGISVQELL